MPIIATYTLPLNFFGIGYRDKENVQGDVRKHKEKHPEKYCKNPKCLYRLEPGTFDPYCTKHGVPKNSSKTQKS